MRLLLIHSDHIDYEAKKPTSMAEQAENLRDSMEDALVAFCAVEAADEDDMGDVVEQAVADIAKTAGQLDCRRVMVYPYAHLASDLATAGAAIDALDAVADGLRATGLEVKRAPFGWYKAFTLACKGHPLSELSRSIVAGGGKEEAVAKKEVEHEWFILTPDGKREDVEKYMDESPFGCLVKKELGVPVGAAGEPPHVELMRSKELVDYEPRSDVGHLRWMPKGKLLRDLIADYVLTLVLPYGAMPVETPVMYDLADQAICEHAAKFGERQYRFRSGNRSMMLRFAACFGMFSIMNGMHISPNTLPMKMYELSTYSFRHEQKGEVIGLKRLRAFTMPDMHSLCRDMDDALKCFEEQLVMGQKSGTDLAVRYYPALRCTRDFYEEHGDWVKKVVKMIGEPTLIEILSERVHYWVAKIDLAAIDAQGRPIENPTVQIDVESSNRFGIRYHVDGQEIHPPILHCSPTGSVERVICAMLETLAGEEVPQFPTWLSATQVRVIPVADRHMDAATALCNRLNDQGIRADLDDREESMNKKVRAAGMEWVPYIVVLGDQEITSGELTVTIRRKSTPDKLHREKMKEAGLVARVKDETAGKPFRPLYTPRLLSVRPRFI
ncbi:MAG TPA: threonine--tRNA ligase [Methanomicrobiales archaeon]|nr:threonine--tRNA ligase [Methanomicrobiales archaeon]